MNIRSMIKHVAAIITAVGMLLASMAGAVTALAEDSKPTTAVDGPTKPVRIMDNLYQTRYTGDYKLDDYLSANAGGNDDYLAWLRANLNHGKPIPLSTTQACTTLAVTDTDTGHDLMVRNMDWYPAVPGMMVATAPTDGYRSVGVAPVMTGKANATPTTDELETSANIAPLTTMDGVNEKGLSAAILQIHRWQAPNDGKPSISQLAVVRLLLDKAATVDEAISLLGRYDIAAYGDKYASLGGLHYALADATGAKATIEFDGGKMHVTRPTDTYQTTTNTMTWNHEIESDRRWKKVDTAVREAGGSMDERDAFGLLAATPSHSTSTLQWTVAYDLDAKTGIITTRGRTDQARTLTLDGIQTAASPVTVRYDANGGRGTITDMTGNPGDQIDIPSTGVTRSGYTLAGWNTKADGTGASIPAGSYTIPADATPHVIGETSGKDGTIDGDFGFKSDTEYQNLLDFGDGIMATIEIPSIGVDLPVRHGADAYALENGAGHLHGTSLPVGGQSTHSVITGHTGVADKALFTRLTELRKGDVFYVRVAAQTLAYKVERIRKVDPDDLRDVRIQPGRDLVTLVTCTPIFLNTYRLLVTGERVSMPDDAPYPEDAPRTTGRDARPLLVSGVALLAGMPVAMVESSPRVRPYGRHGMKR